MKDWFCEKCNKYPDEISEVYGWYAERRKWNEELDCYELYDIKNGDFDIICGECESICIERELK